MDGGRGRSILSDEALAARRLNARRRPSLVRLPLNFAGARERAGMRGVVKDRARTRPLALIRSRSRCKG